MQSNEDTNLRRRFGRRAALRAMVMAGAGLPLVRFGGLHRALADEPPPTLTNRIFLPAMASDGVEPPPTLREKIGRMVITGFDGRTADPGSVIAGDLTDHVAGGVVLFDHEDAAGFPQNIESPEQLLALTNQLKRIDERPVLIGVDQEGGAVARLSPNHGFPATVTAASLGATDDPDVTRAASVGIATTLVNAGITLNFAPICDLNVNPNNPIIGHFDRSFSADPDVVTRNAEIFIRAHHELGLLTTLKHFPGHGSSLADSHLGFVDITNTWSPTELEPFANIVRAGLADLIMVGHLFNANLDANYPATLSHATVTGILRNQLSFNGVVITDSMTMAAITDIYTFETAVQKAIEAGVDILLYASDLSPGENTARRVVDHVEALVTGGVISEARIEESYQRIATLESRYQTHIG